MSCSSRVRVDRQRASGPRSRGEAISKHRNSGGTATMTLNILTTASLVAALAMVAAGQSSDIALAHPWQSFQPGLPSGGGWNATNYQWDDGTSENGLGWTTGGDFCFIMRFDVAGGGQDTIT